MKTHWTKEEDQAVIELFKIYGTKFAELTRALKKVYGIKKHMLEVKGRWQTIDPSTNRSEFTQEESIQLWELYKIHGNNWIDIQASLPKYQVLSHLLFYSSRQKWQLQRFIYFLFKRSIKIMNDVLGQNKMINKHKFIKVNNAVYNDVIKLSKETPNHTDILYNSVIQSCTKLMLLVDKLFYEENRSASNLLDLLSNLINKEELQTIFEHLFLLNTINNIASGTIQPKELERDIQEQMNFISKRGYKSLRLKLPKTWEDAERLNYTQRVKETPDLNLKEIQLIKESQLYQKLRQNPNKHYFDWYNEAVKQELANKNYTIVFQENKTKLVQKEFQRYKQSSNKPKPLWKQLKEQKELFHLQTRFMTQLMEDLETSQ